MTKEDKQFIGWTANAIIGAIFLTSDFAPLVICGAVVFLLSLIILYFGFDA